MPLLDRSNRFMLRNLTALRELRRSGHVLVQQADQVKVGEQQVNVGR